MGYEGSIIGDGGTSNWSVLYVQCHNGFTYVGEGGWWWWWQCYDWEEPPTNDGTSEGFQPQKSMQDWKNWVRKGQCLDISVTIMKQKKNCIRWISLCTFSIIILLKSFHPLMLMIEEVLSSGKCCWVDWIIPSSPLEWSDPSQKSFKDPTYHV